MNGNFSFPKSQRLLKRQQFTRTLDDGLKVVHPLFVMLSQKNEDSSVARLGLIVSKKNGKAVTRNRIKRRLREVFRHNKSSLLGYNTVVIARPRLAQGQQSDLEKAFEESVLRMTKKFECRVES